MNKLSDLTQTLLMGPGPSSVSPSVYKALSAHTIGHLDPRFIEIMDDIKLLLKKIFNTNNDFCMPVSGTGSAAMESCFVNLVSKNDKILIIQNGYFGLRMENMCQRLNANIDLLKFEWGKEVDVNIQGLDLIPTYLIKDTNMMEFARTIILLIVMIAGIYVLMMILNRPVAVASA